MKPLKLNIPESWDSMTEAQFTKIALLFNSHETNAKFYIQLFFLLCGVKKWHFIQKAKLRNALRQFPLSDLHKHYEFIFNENNRTAFPQILKIKKPKKVKLFAPQNRLANLDAEEFSIADDLHIRWRETRDIEILHYLAAVLYTETKKRMVFDKNELHDKALLFKNVPLEKLFAIELAYFGCKNHLVKRFKAAFPVPVKGAAKPKKKYGFGKVILSMAKGDLSKLEKIKRVNIYSFLEQFEEDLMATKASKK